MKEFKIDKTNEGQKVTKFLLKHLDVPKAMVFKLIRKGEVKLQVSNGECQVGARFIAPSKKAKGNEILRTGDTVLVYLPKKWKEKNFKSSNIQLKKGEVDVVWEDEDLMIVNKPAGLACHSGTKHTEDNLINRIKANLGVESSSRVPALVHRIDIGTSGLVIVAKTEKAVIEMGKMLKEGDIDKKYLAVVKNSGGLGDGWETLEDEIKDKREKIKSATSRVRLARFQQPTTAFERGPVAAVATNNQQLPMALVEVELITGRMHQIRQQLAKRAIPIVGDRKYGDFNFNREFAKRTGVDRMLLHAWKLKFKHFRTGEEMDFEADAPGEFK